MGPDVGGTCVNGGTLAGTETLTGNGGLTGGEGGCEPGNEDIGIGGIGNCGYSGGNERDGCEGWELLR